MTGKRLEKIQAGLPSRENRKNPRDMMTSKQKAQRSFSIPRKQRIRGSSTNKLLHQQEKVTNAMNECPSSSTNTSTVDNKTTTESDVLVDTEWRTDDGEWDTDISVEQMRSSEMMSLDEITIAPPMQFRDSEFYFLQLDGGPVASTPLSSSKQKSFHFEGSIESINKAAIIVPSAMVRNAPQQHGEDLAIPDVSYINECNDENDTLKDVDYHLKSISPEQSIQIPTVPVKVNKDSQERNADFDTFSEVPSSDDFEFSDQFIEQNFGGDVEQNFDDENVEQNFDDEDVEQNFEEEEGVTILKSMPNDNHKGRKHNDKIGNSFEDMDNLCGDGLDGNRNIHTDTPKKKGKLYRGVGMKSNSRMGRLLKRKVGENSCEDTNKSDTENNFENVQNIENEELRVSDLDNNPPETASHQRKRNYNKQVRVGNKTQQNAVSESKRSQISTFLGGKYTIVSRNSFEDMNTNDNENSFENVINIQNEELEVNELSNNPPETSTFQAKRKNNKHVRVGSKNQDAVGNLNALQNFTSLRRKHMIEGKNTFKDMNKNDNEDFENVQNIENEALLSDELDNYHRENATRQRETISKVVQNQMQQDVVSNRIGSQNSISSPKKHNIGGGKSLEDMNNSDNENSFENAQNIQDEEVEVDELKNNTLGTSTYQAARRNNKRVRVGNKNQNVVRNLNGSQNLKSLKRKHMIEGRNSFEDVNRSDNEDSIENVQNIQNGELQVDELEKNQQETATQRKDRKFFKHSRSDSKTKQDVLIRNRYQNPNQRRKLKDKVNSGAADIYNYNSEDNLEEAQNTQTDALEKRRLHRVSVKRCSLGSKSRKGTKHFSASKKSKDLEVSKHVQNSQNEGKKLEWPLCCLSNIKNRRFTILKPVIRDDLPIDSITLMGLKEKSKGKCKH